MTISEMERKLYEDLAGAPDMFWKPEEGTHTVQFIGEMGVEMRYDPREFKETPGCEVKILIMDGPDEGKEKLIRAERGTTKVSFAVQLGMFAKLEKEPHLKGRVATIRVTKRTTGKAQRVYKILELEPEGKPTIRKSGRMATL